MDEKTRDDDVEAAVAEDGPPEEATAEAGDAEGAGAAEEKAAAEDAAGESRDAKVSASRASGNGRGEVLIEAVELVKHYGPIKAVDGISFSARRGDILGFMGPNGAGKTTAMRIITGFLAPDSGSVSVSGHDMATDSLAGRQRIGYLPENAPAYAEMTVTGFLEFIAEAREITDGGAIERVIEMAELRRVAHQTIDTLSKGYKRRVGLAQALIHDPEVLILDEPTDGLDPNQKAVVQDLIANLSTGKCIVVSTHILDEVERVCNRAMIISQGRLLVDSTPGELLERSSTGRLDDVFREITQGVSR